MNEKFAAEIVYMKYRSIYMRKNLSALSIGTEIEIPKFSKFILTELIELAKEKMMKEDIVTRVPNGTYVVGDLHGSIVDLLMILKHTKGPGYRKIVFLGDYVDRGDFSIEVITLLLALYVLFPKDIFLIRGNHEFRSVNLKYGFYQQIMDDYPNCASIYESFNDLFNYMPIAAIIGETTLCVHGGISTNFGSISSLEKIPRPIVDFSNPIICDVMWSDPTDRSSIYLENPRGKGQLFGCIALHNFLMKNQILRIMRGHQCVMNCVDTIMNSSCYTIFSSSNYCDQQTNSCGIVKITEEGEVLQYYFDPVRRLTKNMANFTNVELTSSSMSVPLVRLVLPKPLVALCFSMKSPTRISSDRRNFGKLSPSKQLKMFSSTKTTTTGSLAVPIIPQLRIS